MLRKYAIIVAAVAVFLIAGSLLVTASAVIDQKGVLAGTVTSLIVSGTAVREGDILVSVDTLTGSVPAARATSSGVVAEVLVKKGDTIQIGQIVARIQGAK